MCCFAFVVLGKKYQLQIYVIDIILIFFMKINFQLKNNIRTCVLLYHLDKLHVFALYIYITKQTNMLHQIKATCFNNTEPRHCGCKRPRLAHDFPLELLTINSDFFIAVQWC